MTFKVIVFGCGAATPTLNHHPSSQVVNLHDKLFMVDCGEGTQLQCRKFGFGFQKISAIFISHLHGDHYLGLIGLMSSMHLLGRKQKLLLFGPPALEELIRINLELSETRLDYEVVFQPTSDQGMQMIHEDHTLEVYSFPLRHRVYCTGFLFKEKQRPLKVPKDVIEQYGLMPTQILSLKKGVEIELEGGAKLLPDVICVKPPDPRLYAYCSDTIYDPKIVEFINKADLLYHESTFLNTEETRANQTFHSTAEQAAKIAKASKVRHLMLGHFSSRYRDEEPFLIEAGAIFESVSLAFEGREIDIPYRG
jgi:ribonuclease Z